MLPMVHIAGLVIGLLNPLAQGATVVILPKFEPLEFLQAVQKYRVFLQQYTSILPNAHVLALAKKKKTNINVHVLNDLVVSKMQGTFSLLAPPIVNFLANDPMVDQFDLSSLRDPYSGASTLGKELTEKMVQRLKLDGIRQGTCHSLLPQS